MKTKESPTVAKKSAAKKEEDLVICKVLKTSRFWTGTTNFTVAKGAVVTVPRKTGEEKAKTDEAVIIG